MIQSTHTPGPWTVSQPSGNYIDTSTGSVAALTYGASKADAHLIAAAPDLLAALENLLALTELHIAERSKTPEEEDDFLSCPHITQARATIAKAKGAQHD
jgi:hypothetical protein